jgi:hypothetical protein
LFGLHTVGRVPVLFATSRLFGRLVEKVLHVKDKLEMSCEIGHPFVLRGELSRELWLNSGEDRVVVLVLNYGEVFDLETPASGIKPYFRDKLVLNKVGYVVLVARQMSTWKRSALLRPSSLLRIIDHEPKKEHIHIRLIIGHILGLVFFIM